MMYEVISAVKWERGELSGVCVDDPDHSYSGWNYSVRTLLRLSRDDCRHAIQCIRDDRTRGRDDSKAVARLAFHRKLVRELRAILRTEVTL